VPGEAGVGGPDAGTGAGSDQAAVRGRPAERGLDLARLIIVHSLRLGLGPDGRLPTERQLAADLGISRSSVRYALAIMEARGELSREVGRGTYLRAPVADFGSPGDQPGQPAAAQSAFAPADVMLVRRLLEPPAMPLAVAWATAGDFAEMDRCLAGGDRAASYEEFESWDLALHKAIIAATHSPLLATLYASIEMARHGHIWGDLKRRSASAERRSQYQADHHEIVAALKARDPAAAVRTMRAHLARVSDHLNATDPAAGSWP
jgi:DNA-binding FadR family transcriptional regulator